MTKEKNAVINEQKKKVNFSFVDLVSNTEGQSVSATGLCGTLIIMVALIVFIASVIFYFCNVAEANNIFTIINSAITLVGIGAGVLGVRRISSDFGPNNRITIGGSANAPDDQKVVYVQRKLYSSENPTTEEDEIEPEMESENEN